MYLLAFRRDGFESSKPTFQCYIAKTKEEGNYNFLLQQMRNYGYNQTSLVEDPINMALYIL